MKWRMLKITFPGSRSLNCSRSPLLVRSKLVLHWELKFIWPLNLFLGNIRTSGEKNELYVTLPSNISLISLANSHTSRSVWSSVSSSMVLSWTQYGRNIGLIDHLLHGLRSHLSFCDKLNREFKQPQRQWWQQQQQNWFLRVMLHGTIRNDDF